MGFASSLIILSVLGLLSHYFYQRFGIAKGKLAWISYFTLFINLGFLILDVLIYAGGFNFLFPIFNNLPWVFIENGRDFMWNSFQLIGINWSISYNSASLNPIAILLFISYPIWFMFFKDFSRKIFGGNEKRPYTKGISFLFTLPKKTKNETDFTKKPELGD